MQEIHKCLAGCGKTITWRFALCSNCELVYGKKATEWPDWLRWLWIHTQRERRLIKKQMIYEVPYEENDFEVQRQYTDVEFGY